MDDEHEYSESDLQIEENSFGRDPYSNGMAEQFSHETAYSLNPSISPENEDYISAANLFQTYFNSNVVVHRSKLKYNFEE